jgi:5-carboxymethyl-2-hydroxymuconate isomerase
MPHIVVEYSSNLEGLVDVSDMLNDMHSALAAEGVDKFRVKTRGVSIPHSVVGDTAPNVGQMIHITLLLLEGRDDALKQQYSKPLYNVAKSATQSVVPDCSVTLEVRDMSAATYIL